MKKVCTGKTVFLLAILFLVANSSAVFSQEESSPVPPKDLKLVHGHWTAWDSPAPGPDSYIIVKGDTLWDLAEKWLEDPYLWPQIWDENRYIQDSHWIYPGDPLVVPGRPTVVPPEGPDDGDDGDDGDQGAVVEQPVDQGFGRDADVEEPVAPPMALRPVANFTDVYCSGYIDPEPRDSDVRVVGAELEKEHLAQGDVVYLNYGMNQGVKPGDQMAIRRTGKRVVHPGSGETLGTYIRRLGKLRVIAVQENTSIASIEESCEDIWLDDHLVEWEEIPIPMATALPRFDQYAVEPSGGVNGTMVLIRDRLKNAAEGHIIYTDLGAGSGAMPGDVLTVYRDNGDLPRLMLGQAVILTVEPNSSTARITTSVRESFPGDLVEIRQGS
jgi:hypothetical protein